MRKIVIGIWVITWLLSGCAQFHSKEEIVYDEGKLQKFSYFNESQGSRKSEAGDTAFLDAIEVIRKTDPAAFPQLADMPRFQKSTKPPVGIYTGVIKNTTKYDVSVPSMNSEATLQIPAHGWIEYRAYIKNFDLTVYSDGKPFYCLKICADPKNFQYMCKNYDFIAEIVRAEPIKKPTKMKRRIKKKPKGEEGAPGLG